MGYGVTAAYSDVGLQLRLRSTQQKVYALHGTYSLPGGAAREEATEVIAARGTAGDLPPPQTGLPLTQQVNPWGSTASTG